MKHKKTIENLGGTTPCLYFIRNIVRELDNFKIQTRYYDQMPMVKVGLSGIAVGKNQPRSYCWRIIDVCRNSDWFPEIERLYSHSTNDISAIKEAERDIKIALKTWNPKGLTVDNRVPMSTEVFKFRRNYVKELLNYVDSIALKHNLNTKPILFKNPYYMYCFIEGKTIPWCEFYNYLRSKDEDKIELSSSV